MKFSTNEIVRTGLFIALVYIATLVNFRLPFSIAGGGLVHLGTSAALISIYVLGKRNGTIAGTIGMTLFDITTGYGAWAPFTFIARLLFGISFYHLAFDKDGKLKGIVSQIIAVVCAGIILVCVYFVANTLISGSFEQAIASIPGDITQVVVAMIIGIPIGNTLNSVVKHL